MKVFVFPIANVKKQFSNEILYNSENNKASFLDLMIMSEDSDLTVKNMEDEVNNFIFSVRFLNFL